MAEEVEVNAGLRIDCEYGCGLIPDHHRECARDEHRNQIGQALPLAVAGLLTSQHVNKIDCRQAKGHNADNVREARNGQNLIRKQEEEQTAEGQNTEYKAGNRLLLLCRRQRIVRLHSDRAEGALLKRQIDRTSECTDNAEDEEGLLIADHQGNGTDNHREHSADVREHILNRERTVSPFIALGIELAEQRVHGAAGDHTVQVADAAVENHADNAEPRNREGEIEEWPGDGTKTIGPSISEHAVRHEGTDYREDRGKCRIEGDNLRCLHLREADSLGSCRIEVIDEDGCHTVAGNLPHHKLEVHDADAKGMADETGFVLQLLDLFLPLSLLFIEYCCCNCFHKQEPPIAMKKLLQPVKKKQTSFPIRFSSAKPPL